MFFCEKDATARPIGVDPGTRTRPNGEPDGAKPAGPADAAIWGESGYVGH